MRSVDMKRRAALVAMAAGLAMLAACGTTSEPGSSRSGGSGTPGSTSGNAAGNGAPSGPPVGADVQRAFDDATALMRANRADEAERALRTLAVAHPELAGPHANLGVILRKAGRLPDAVGELEQAVRLSPRQAVFRNQLGVAYRMSGQFAKAREAYTQAIALDPRYAAPVLNLGILNDLYLNDPATALTLYDRYLMLSPGGDATVTKWVAELKTRKPAPVTVSRKEKE